MTDLLAAAAPWFMLGSLAFLAGSAFGYWTARSDAARERARGRSLSSES